MKTPDTEPTRCMCEICVPPVLDTNQAPDACVTNNCYTASHDDTRRQNKRNGGATRGRGTKESFVSGAKLTALTNPLSLHDRA